MSGLPTGSGSFTLLWVFLVLIMVVGFGYVMSKLIKK